MCRISGTVNYPISEVTNMVTHQQAGGPDSCKVVSYNNVTFGHNLLSIIGHQEQPVENDRYLMTFNGCWYDFKHYYPYATCDTNALLDHFTRRGLGALGDVNGMFAIGLYDKVENKLHLIVDRFGQKPIYYYHSCNKFAFASNPAALYNLLPSKELDRDALNTYWLLGSVMGDKGIFKGIKKVCASEMITLDLLTNTLTTKKWYEPKFQDNTSGIEELVYDAIDKVKISDVPVHIFLSGGIDSTLVASRFAGGNAIHLNSDELIYAREVADKFNINLKVVQSLNIDTEECLNDYVMKSGEPTMAGLIPYITSREVSKFGRVAITANGADELFFGYNRTSHWMTPEQVNHMIRSIMSQRETHDLLSPIIVGKHNYKSDRFNTGHGRWFELMAYVQYDLNKTLDSASMCHGLEMRAPFLDHRLVEMALSIGEKEHRVKGNKSILKAMVKKLGFSDQFINRPKIGFSIKDNPKDIEMLTDKALKFCLENGFLKVDFDKLGGRDQQYLKMSALGFWIWHRKFIGLE